MDPAPGDKADASTLTGVSETALLTLNGRAHQARHPHAIIDDPMAIRLVDSIDFDFDKFGRKGQEMALRSLAFDRAATRYLSQHPAATVVALAEGLQTSFWRLDNSLPNAEFHWLTVDFPPVIALRQRLLPASPRIVDIAQSALDYTWMDRGGLRQRCLHHRGGAVDVPTARRGDGPDQLRVPNVFQVAR